MFTSVLDGFVSRLGFKSIEKGKDDGGIEDLFSAKFQLAGNGCGMIVYVDQGGIPGRVQDQLSC